jgi:hypothetical protein
LYSHAKENIKYRHTRVTIPIFTINRVVFSELLDAIIDIGTTSAYQLTVNFIIDYTGDEELAGPTMKQMVPDTIIPTTQLWVAITGGHHH